MNRTRLKNIINKSKELSKPVGEPYDLFVASLPSELDYYKDGGKYRLKAAWKAYGEPKNYQEALWNGLVETLDGKTFVMPSIGYNESKDRYEYLNTGKENETVNKDIRVWENNVIPFIQELKQGGYVRTFIEEENCWSYSKNQPSQENPNGEINSFKKGGKAKELKAYKDFIKYIVDTDRNGGHYDYEGFWNDEDLRNDWINEEDQNPGKAHFPDKYKLPTHPTFSTDSKYSNSATEGGTWTKDDSGKWTFTTSPYIESRSSLEDMQRYFKEYEPGVTLIYKGVPYGPFAPTPYFKNGGQMNVIPEGALHARKNNMPNAGEDYTAKGIPVVDMNGVQQAEIERNEIILNLDTSKKIEKYLEQFKNTESKSEQDEIAIKCGKMLSKSIIEDTQDNTGLIEDIANKN